MNLKVQGDCTEKPRRLLENPDAKLSMYINDISRLFTYRAKRAAERSGIPAGYLRVLPELGRNDGATQLELARLTRLSAPTVSVAVTKMENDGLVRREPDPKDMRQLRVFLTDKGREGYMKVRSCFRETDALLADCLSEDEQAALLPMLRKMLVHLLELEDGEREGTGKVKVDGT